MPKKIYDIKPPKVAKKIEKEIKEFLTADTKRKKPGARGKKKKERRPIWQPILVGALVILLIVCLYLFFKLPKADIAIWPKVDKLSFKQTITADKSIDTVDIAKTVIPAQYFQATKTNSQDFPATGNASNDGKASGNITIYNKYDPAKPMTLKAGTRFLSDSGKLFVTLQKVVVPAAKKVGNKITPGSTKIQVQAAESGADYNIAPANFSVPGLKGTAYYYSIYAASASAMTGGYVGNVKKVTADDIQGAKDVLTAKTTSDAINALKGQISSEYILLDNAVLTNVAKTSTPTKAGAIAENFNYQVTVTASALAFRKSDIDQFVKNYALSQLSEGKTLLDNSTEINYSAIKVDVSGGKATLNLDFSLLVYQDVNKDSIGLSLMDKNANQVRETINSRLGDQVLRIETRFWPFWVTTVPNSQKAVNVELKF